MSIFDRFRRNRQQSVLPNEVQEYYQTEKRQRRGVAVMLAVGALLATILVAAALFFGGRFLYNQLWGNDEQGTEQTSENQDQDNNSDAQTATPETPATPPTGTTPSNPAPQTPTPTPTPAPAPAAPAPTTPALGDASPLPRTGDEGL